MASWRAPRRASRDERSRRDDLLLPAEAHHVARGRGADCRGHAARHGDRHSIRHRWRWDIAGGIDVSHVYLTKDRLQSCADVLTNGKPVELLGRVGFDDPTTARILELLAREAAMAESSSRLFIEQAIDLLCTQLVRGHSTFGVLKSPAPQRGLATWQVRRVTEHMQDHLGADMGLGELAAIVGLSRFHFCTAFRLATGRTPHEWLTQARIERAQAMLTEPGAAITEVALAVGYSTPSAFTAAFRRVTGTTPSEFRRRL
jgi:AraC family transcriptional regulator